MPFSRSIAMALAVAALAGSARAADLPPDLGFVHPDALGFVHVRLADVWKHEAMHTARALVAKAGPKAVAALDEQFVPPPTAVERMTMVALTPPAGRPPEPLLLVVVRFSRAFDPVAVRKAYLPAATTKKAGGKEYFADDRGAIGLHFPDDLTLVFGEPEVVEAYLTIAPKADGGLTPALTQAAAGTTALTAAVNLARLPLPPGFADQLPPDFRPLAATRLLVATLDLGQQATLTVRATYDDAAAATAAEGAVKKTAEMGKAALVIPRAEAERVIFGQKPATGPRPVDQLPEAVAALGGLGAIAWAEEILSDLPLKRDGNALTASAVLPAWMTQYWGASALSLGLMLPAVQKVRESAARQQSMNNLKQIALAMHIHHDSLGVLPPAAITDKKTGKRLLSWRVAILPFIENDALYRQFKLDEPWDSPANKKLIQPMPKVFADPRLPAPPGQTYYKVFVGKHAAFDWDKGRRFAAIPDGTSNTLMAVAGGDPVIWTKPDDIEFDPEKPLPELFKPFRDLLAAFCDGLVRVLPPTTDAKTLKAVITADGGEVVNLP